MSKRHEDYDDYYIEDDFYEYGDEEDSGFSFSESSFRDQGFSYDGRYDRGHHRKKSGSKSAGRSRAGYSKAGGDGRRKRKHRGRIIGWIAVAVAAVLVLAVLGRTGVIPSGGFFGQRGSSSAVEGEEADASGTAGAGASGEQAGNGTAEDGGSGTTETGLENGSTEGTDDAAEGGTDSDGAEGVGSEDAPYVFRETAATIDLGQSLTDISVYDSQRHIVKEDGSSDSDTDSTDESDAGTSSGTDSSESSTAGTEDDPAMAPDYVDSQYAILINTDTGEIVAEREGKTRIVPASMTKVMTLLTAVDAMENPEQQMSDTFEMTQEIADEVYLSGSSFVGYAVGDEVKVEDLMYGAILPSGGDAAMGLAEYTAGSQEAFAELMNQEAEKLGISSTSHFTNCVGLYDEDHYSTPYDMAVIMRAAYESELCRRVLSAHTWTVSPTAGLPDGAELSNWFLRKIEDHVDSGTVECAKTGFVNESGNCAVSTYTNAAGTHYIACTALTYSSWRCIFDHANLYMTYAQE